MSGYNIPPFFRCECGKLHARAGIRADSFCTCGRKLWARVFPRQNGGRS